MARTLAARSGAAPDAQPDAQPIGSADASTAVLPAAPASEPISESLPAASAGDSTPSDEEDADPLKYAGSLGLKTDVKTMRATPKEVLKLLHNSVFSKDIGMSGLDDYIESLRADIRNAGDALLRMLHAPNAGIRIGVDWVDPVTGSSSLNGPRIASAFIKGDTAIIKAVTKSL